uniref:carbon-nitrogen hydrolase family protein n=1 Tax=uncultured Altererythrobacter sp. TaxID=500840 RepID=UPI0026347237|nr:carbon-nitrogen hydrolase family protein [uncultured Altererythrobacter sp.]
MPRIAVLQMTSGVDPDANYFALEAAAIEAGKGGAEILFTPEMSVLLDKDRKRAGPWIESTEPARISDRLAELSAEAGIDLAIGSMPVMGTNRRWANRSFYFGGSLGLRATYDKIHMFDVQLSNGETWRESAAYEPGTQVVTIDDTPLGRLGLTICYDMRFPALFEQLGQRKCDAIAVPAAFTVPTGRDHWHVMLRARAIEASAFVIAAAQVGQHEDGRETYGHSLVVDPWGEVLLDMGGDKPGLAYCDIDLSRVEEVRSQLPSLANRRPIAK